jgi:hypothetical protein
MTIHALTKVELKEIRFPVLFLNLFPIHFSIVFQFISNSPQSIAESFPVLCPKVRSQGRGKELKDSP